MTLENFIAELETTFSIYFETGDIDRVSIKTWVISCLREFGKNICEQREAIVEVKNSQATLPETFKSLILALDLTECGYEIKGDKEKIKDSFIYRERLEQTGYYDFSSHTFVNDSKAKLITESIVVNNVPVEFYHKPNYLSVVKGFKKDSFDVDCLNLHPSIRNAYSNQISINKNTLQANFKNGRIYIQYNSLPFSEEDDEVMIPFISTGDIEKYIENYVKIKIAESLILGNKNPTNIQPLLQMWLSQDRALRLAAKSEANWSGLGNFKNTYKHKLQVEFNKYSLPRF